MHGFDEFYGYLYHLNAEPEDPTIPRIQHSKQNLAHAVCLIDWKLIFTMMEGDSPTAYRKSPAWPKIVSLRQDLFERFVFESKMYTRWWADKMFFMVPAQTVIGKYLESLKEFPPTP